MPLVIINLKKGRSPAVKRAMADAVHAALVAKLWYPGHRSVPAHPRV